MRVIGINSFGQANGALGAPFFPSSGGAVQNFVTSNNIAYCNPLNADCTYYYNAFATARGNQWAETVLSAPTTQNVAAGYGPACCVSSGTDSYYRVIANQIGWQIRSRLNGVSQWTVVGSATKFANGDRVMLVAAADTPTGLTRVTAYKNRAPFVTVLDATNLQGQPGIFYSSTDAAGAGISAFTCGDMIQEWVADPAVRGTVHNFSAGAGTTLVTTVTQNVVEGDAIHVYCSVDYGVGINPNAWTVGDTSSNGYTLLSCIGKGGTVQQFDCHYYCSYARGNPAMTFGLTTGNGTHRTIVVRVLSNVLHYQPVDGQGVTPYYDQPAPGQVADSLVGIVSNSYQPSLLSVFCHPPGAGVRPTAGTGMTSDNFWGEGSSTLTAHANVNTVGNINALFSTGSTAVLADYHIIMANFAAPQRNPDGAVISRLQKVSGA